MKFSVIIPVYNREKTLYTCLNSVLNTDFNDFEILLINDGSTDSSRRICKEYADKHRNIKLIDQPNQGVSSARNSGIQAAQGDYLLFIDSDDAYAPNALSTIALNILDEDLLIFDTALYAYSNRTLKYTTHLHHNPSTELKGTNNIIDWLYTEYDPYKMPLFSVCTKAYKRKIVINHNIFFREDITIGEDQIFNCTYLKYVSSMRYINLPLHYWITWPSDLRPNGSELVLKDIHKTLYNQLENYKALSSLHKHTCIESVKEYATNYILDRPISRIVHKHFGLNSDSSISFIEMAKFVSNSIKPILKKEHPNIYLLKNKAIARQIHIIVHGHSFLLLLWLWMKKQLKKLFRKLRHKYGPR